MFKQLTQNTVPPVINQIEPNMSLTIKNTPSVILLSATKKSTAGKTYKLSLLAN